jgi:hypothetical protein
MKKLGLILLIIFVAAISVNSFADGISIQPRGAKKGANSDITSLSGLTTPLTVAQGGQGSATLADGGLLVGAATAPIEVVAAGATTEVLVGGGASTNPVWTTATGTGAPARAGSPTFTTKITTPQVVFPATAVPSADVNTLDDYQEGTWTIGVSFGGGVTGITYANNTGWYTKIGNMVTVGGYLALSNKGSDTGSAAITGLPFTCAAGADKLTAASLRFKTITFANVYMGYVSANTTTILLEESLENGTVTDLTNADFANTSQIIIGASYEMKD